MATTTCVLNVLMGLPLAYAIQAGARGGVRLAARIVTLLPVAVPGAGAGLRLHPGILVRHAALARLLLAAGGGPPVVTLPYTVPTLVADMDQLRLADFERIAASWARAS